jgi:hypothetical protein
MPRETILAAFFFRGTEELQVRPQTSFNFYNYRVLAQGSRSQFSEWSNTAVCFGM